MTDGGMRAVALQKFYELRHTHEVVQLSDVVGLAPAPTEQIANICDQLAEHGLIKWTGVRGGFGYTTGMGKITAYGVDVIEGNAQADIKLVFHDESISIRDSSHVQVGDRNIQVEGLEIGKLLAAVDRSTASDGEKSDAKSLLTRLLDSKLALAILTAFLTGGGSAH
jgi:hypothetical protein